MVVPSETVKSGAGLPVCAGCAPRLHADEKGQWAPEQSQIEETRKPHILIIRSERAERKRRGAMSEDDPAKNRRGRARNWRKQARRRWKPVLGLADPAEGAAPRLGLARMGGQDRLAGTVFDQPEPEQLIELTVIVPARNEEDCLGACLQSLVSQSEEIFELGKDWELIVVDDHSTDRTAEIARGFAGVTRDRGGQAGAGMDGQGQRRLDGGAAGARPLAALHRRGHDPRAGRPAPRHARGGAAQGGHAELLAAADCERASRSGR